MKVLNVYIEIQGHQIKVGTLEGNTYQDTCFVYDSEYILNPFSRPISISLPLRQERFSTYETRTFFESLLPEGFSRKSVANWARTNEEDYITLLECLGEECIGAIQIAKDVRITDCRYIPIDNKELLELAKEGATKSTEMLMESHISLAGASGKVGLFFDKANNKWFKPYGVAASTHIIKQSYVRHEHLVLNENICMLTAKKLNIEVPDCFIINVGTGQSEELLYAIERFDRQRINEDGICTPHRLHQEDFAQALGIPASEKYETENKGYLKKMFELVTDYSSNPIEDGLKLWDRIIFNYMIGNTDAHIKNYGLLYSDDLKKIRLSPAYDIVCTRIYGNRNDMSIMINGKLDCTSVDREDFEVMARKVSIGYKVAMEHYDNIANNIERALQESILEMKEMGFNEAEELGERINDTFTVV